MRKLGKKGQGIEVLLKDSGLSIAVIIILLVLASATGTWIFGRGQEQKCSFSVWAADIANTALLDWPLDCPAPHEEILYGTDQKTYATIATHMKTCWAKMGKGKKDPLGTVHLGNSYRCVVCSSFSLREDVNWLDVVAFMESTPMPPTGAMTYSEFIDTTLKTHYTLIVKGIPPDLNSEDTRTLVEHWANIQMYRRATGQRDRFNMPAKYQGNPIKYLVLQFANPEAKHTDWVLWIGRLIVSPLVSDEEWEAIDTYEGTYNLVVVDEREFSKMECDAVYWQRET